MGLAVAPVLLPKKSVIVRLALDLVLIVADAAVVVVNVGLAVRRSLSRNDVRAATGVEVEASCSSRSLAASMADAGTALSVEASAPVTSVSRWRDVIVVMVVKKLCGERRVNGRWQVLDWLASRKRGKERASAEESESHFFISPSQTPLNAIAWTASAHRKYLQS